MAILFLKSSKSGEISPNLVTLERSLEHALDNGFHSFSLLTYLCDITCCELKCCEGDNQCDQIGLFF